MLEKAKFIFKQKSPFLAMGSGLVIATIGIFEMCKATLKVPAIMEESKEELETIEEINEKKGGTEEYPAEQYKHDKFTSGKKTAVELAKIYILPTATVVTGFGLMFLSNHILTKRNAVLTAGYTAVSAAFKNYRGNVVERFGEEVDYQLRNNIKAKKIKETIVDENGEEKEVEKTVYVRDKAPWEDDFSLLIDDRYEDRIWFRDPRMTLRFLLKAQDDANHMLRARGVLLLKDVYDLLGIYEYKCDPHWYAMAHTYGWRYIADGNQYGDNKVDFGLTALTMEDAKDIEALNRFLNCLEHNVWLNFNVDGPVIEMMRKEIKR